MRGKPISVPSAHLQRGAFVLTVLLVCAVSTALAQQSEHYRVEEHVRNAGGRPLDRNVAQSPSFRVTHDGIGDAAAGTAVKSGSFAVSGGFVTSFPPPGEVAPCDGPMGTPCQAHLWIADDKETIHWPPERSVGVYNLYRGGLPEGSWATPGSRTWGDPLKCDIDPFDPLQGEKAVDPSMPVTGEGLYYLVSAENQLSLEGTLGYTSGLAGGDIEREPASVCP